ncbi:terminase large subunit [Gordonia phage VanLee]|uniref:Terminase large subunit n=1 Tax=Gordonia phage VanLee TaxID=2845816 RepID=A0A8F2DA73_9CAUD|nr:terminase large subunit [Gordonia phage VanLee]QWS68121.1 terminase large subunit [Gordonia phage VanLee]
MTSVLAPDNAVVGMGPKQIRSIAESDFRVNVWTGAVRSGKTIASILRWFMFLANPPDQPGQFVMVGRTRDSLARNVIDVMQDERLFGDLATEVTYRTGAPFATILGRKVYVLGAHDSQAEKVLRGLTVAGAYVDEITVIQQDFFKQLLARMSVDDAKLFGTTNPDNPMHWLKEGFLDRIGDGDDQIHDWRAWHFELDDNPRLSEKYKASLKAEYTGLWYRRFILGHWVSAEGAVFDFWDPDRFVVPWEKLPRMTELVSIGVDYGTTNPTVASLLGRGEDNVMYIVDEWSHESKEAEHRWSDAQLSRGIRNFRTRQHLPPNLDPYAVEEVCDIVVVDPAAASLRVQLSQDGLHTYAADNDVRYGIKLMSSLFGRGRLKVSSRCTRLIREIPGYSWDPRATDSGEDVPIKKDDHAIDSVRYALVSTEGRWRPSIDSTAIDHDRQPA